MLVNKTLILFITLIRKIKNKKLKSSFNYVFLVKLLLFNFQYLTTLFSLILQYISQLTLKLDG